MSNEDVKKGTTVFDKNESGVVGTISRRQWHKPPVTRIEIKRTLCDVGSMMDGAQVTTW